jgi:hypothetical protein
MKSEIANQWDREYFDYFDSPFGSIKEDHRSQFEAHFHQVDTKREDVCVFNKVLSNFEIGKFLEPFDEKSAFIFTFKEEKNMEYFKTNHQNTIAQTFDKSKVASWNFDEDLTKYHHDEANEQKFRFDDDKLSLEVCICQKRVVCQCS